MRERWLWRKAKREMLHDNLPAILVRCSIFTGFPMLPFQASGVSIVLRAVAGFGAVEAYPQTLQQAKLRSENHLSQSLVHSTWGLLICGAPNPDTFLPQSPRQVRTESANLRRSPAASLATRKQAPRAVLSLDKWFKGGLFFGLGMPWGGSGVHISHGSGLQPIARIACRADERMAR